jgi:uncharacterized protein (DUF2236 family)
MAAHAWLCAVTPLPPPPILEGLLDGQPWLVSGLLVLVGGGAWWFLRPTRHARAGAAAGAGLALAAALLQVLAAAVTTDRERVRRATRELVAAAAAGDRGALDPLLAPGARAFSSFQVPEQAVPAQGLDKAQILERLPRVVEAYQVRAARVLEVQAQANTPSVAVTQARVSVRAGASYYEVPYTSWWRIGWQKDQSGEWRAATIEPLELPGVAG